MFACVGGVFVVLVLCPCVVLVCVVCVVVCRDCLVSGCVGVVLVLCRVVLALRANDRGCVLFVMCLRLRDGVMSLSCLSFSLLVFVVVFVVVLVLSVFVCCVVFVVCVVVVL